MRTLHCRGLRPVHILTASVLALAGFLAGGEAHAQTTYPAPTGLSAEAASEDASSFDLSWTAVTAPDGHTFVAYVIGGSVNSGSDFPHERTVTGASTASYTFHFPGVAPASNVRFRIKATYQDTSNMEHGSAWHTMTGAPAVTNLDPKFTSSNTASVKENTTAVLTVVATDDDTQDSVTGYSLSGGADRSKFSIVAETGVLSFSSAPDFETPGDVASTSPSDEAGNNNYIVEVRATSGTADRVRTEIQTITVTVTNVDKPGAPGQPSVSGTTATSVSVSWAAPSSDGGQEITGYDVQYRTPADTGSWEDATHSGTGRTATISGLTANREYGVQVRAKNPEDSGDWSDEGKASTNAPPRFTSPNAKSVAENTAAVLTVVATDEDAADSQVTYSLTGGADRGKFSLTGAALSFRTAPDFEANGSAAGNNTYVVQVRATSGAGGRAKTATQTITVTVTDENEPPEFTSPNAKSVAENTAAVLTVVATDEDAADSQVTYSLTGGADQGKFSLTGAALSFRTAPDFEANGSAAGNNAYVVQVTATSGAGGRAKTATRTITVTVTDENEPPEFTSPNAKSVAENTAAVLTVVATDEDAADSQVTYLLTGGADQGKFSLTGAALSFRTAPDFEANGSAAGNNAYVVQVTATSGAGGRAKTATQTITVTVTDENEPPAAPAAPTVTSVSASELKAVWTAPVNTGKPEITNYDLQYRPSGESETLVEDVGTDLAEPIGSLDAGTSHDVRVRAKNDEGKGDWSDWTTKQTAPAKLTGLIADAGVDRLEVSWTATKGATGTKVQWKSGSQDYNATRTVTSAGTSATISSLTAGVTYTVRVIATHPDTPDAEPSDEETGTPLAEISIAAGTTPVDEGTAAAFTLTRSSGASNLEVTVSVTQVATFLATHSATNPSDRTVTFAGSATTTTLSLPTHADTWDEDDGTFSAAVKEIADDGYVVSSSRGSAGVTVRDNDDTPVLSLADASVGEGAGTHDVCVTMAPPSHKQVQVPLSTSDGTAVSAGDKDYTAHSSTTLTIAPGSAADVPNTQACAPLSVTDDGLLEDPETLTTELGSPLNAVRSTTNASATVTITDNETAAAVDLSASTYRIAEDSATALEVCAGITPLAGKTIAVAVNTTDGSARTGRDYGGLRNETLEFPEETAQVCLPVTIIDNTNDDGDRDFAVRLAAPVGLDSRVTVGGTTGSATVTIEDEDVVPGKPQNVDTDPWSSEVLLTWEAGAAGSDPITGYEYRYKGSGDYGGWTSAGEVTSKMISGLTNGQAYTFQVRAVNEVGAGAESSGETATPQFSLTRVTIDAPDTSLSPGTELGTGAIFRVHRTGATSRSLNVYLYIERMASTSTNDGPDIRANTEAVTFSVGAGTVYHEKAVARTDTLARATVNDGSGYVVGTPSVAEITIVANADNLPGAPGNLQAGRGAGQVALSWTAGTPGDSAIIMHRYRKRTGTAFGQWTDIPLSAPGRANATSYLVSGLTNGTEYTFQVQAVNGEGGGPASNEASATPTGADITAPVLSSAVVKLATVTLTYNEPLDGGSTPPASAFTVTVPDSTRTVSAVSVAGTAVTFTIDPPAAAGDTATLTYTVPAGPGAMPIQDVAGNDAGAVSGRTLTNDSPTAPGAPSNLEAERGNGEVTLTWTASADDGGSPVTGHRYQQRVGTAGTWSGRMDIRDSAPGGANATSFTVENLANETQHFFQVRAVNRVGESDPSNEADATPTAADITPPVLTDLRVTGARVLALTYDEPLDETSTPPAGFFQVTVDGAGISVTGVSVSGTAVALSLAEDVEAGAAVALTYTPDLAKSTIRDPDGNHAPSMTGRPAANFPGAPEQRVPGPGNGEVRLNWTPGRDGGSPLTGHRYQQRVGAAGSWGDEWTTIARSAPGGANERSHVVSGLENGTEYFFRVQAVNAVGESPPSNALGATPEAEDTTAPELVDAEVNGATLTLAWNEVLDETSTPAAADFEVSAADGATRTAAEVFVADAAVTLAIEPAAEAGETLTLGYTPGTQPIQDLAGNPAAAFSGEAVRNVTGATTAAPPRVPLMAPASHPHRQGFVRVVNHSAEAGEVAITAIDDEGTRYGPVTLRIEANEAVHFNSADLETGNARKGLESGTGAGEGSWRLELESALDIEVLSYVRTHDGFVTSMHEFVPVEAGAHRVVFFNPGSNRSQVSRLRLINPGEAPAAVRIEGLDDAGEWGEGAVTLALEAGTSRTLTSQALESGEDGGLAGALGDGKGKWRLRVSADRPIRVMSLLRSPTAHLTNLSAVPVEGEPGDVPAHRIPLMAPASHPHRQGFVRVVNHSAEAGEVAITAIDDEGTRYGPVTLRIEANEAVHFNSADLETGNARKGLEPGTGAGEGSWRLELESALDIEVLSYVRTHDGFVTSMHEFVPVEAGAHRVVFFNPGSNRSQVSRLRLINPGEAPAAVRIEGLDDAGEWGEGAVTLALEAGTSRTLTSQALESGEDGGLAGALGDGRGKWRLRVSADRPIRVMSLLRSPTEHLTNLSAVPGQTTR